nr:endolytic transglycosylase MltG [Desulfobulbaceae bacterium]
MVSNSPDPVDNFEVPQVKEGKRISRWLMAVLISLIVVPVGFYSWVWLYANSPGASGYFEKIQVYIPPKSGFPQIEKILIESRVIEDDFRFRLLARYLGVSTRLKAGEYVFTAEHTPLLILKDIEQGKTIPRTLAIAEGLNIYQIAEKIASGGWGRPDELLLLMSDPEFLSEMGVRANSLEGYLFPDTYFFERSDSPQHILATMFRRMQTVILTECENASLVEGVLFDCDGQAGEAVSKVENSKAVDQIVRLSVNQVLTLASIVEKETGFSEERPLVAKVFINRLKKGMRLQADPTVVYGLKKFGQQLSRKDLKTPTPYNTYTETGLPAGPICNPGKASISAVFNPAAENYLYFVLQEDGGHYFSNSLKEHNQAVARLRKFEKEN